MDALTFAMGPVLADDDGDELRQRFEELLADRLGRPAKVVVAPSYAEVSSLVARAEAHVAWLSPAVFVKLERTSKVHLLAAVDRAHGKGYRGVLFVPANSSVIEPDELRGKRMAWVDPDSCAGHLFVRLALKKRALDPAGLFGEQRFFGSHASVVHAVMRGDADAGATFAQVGDDDRTLTLAGWFPFLGVSGMRSILISDPIPPDVICASSSLDLDALEDVREALLSLHEDGGDEILDEIFDGPRLTRAHTIDYDPVRAAIQ